MFCLYVTLTISYFRAQTIETSSLHTESSQPLFKQIEIFSILTVRLYISTVSTFKSRLSLIVRVNVVLNRTVVVDSDWRFDNLCGSHLQSQSELYHVSWWYYALVIDLIGQLCRDVIGRLSVKPWCYWLWRLVISDWCVSIRLLSQLNSCLLLVKLSVLQLFSRS